MKKLMMAVASLLVATELFAVPACPDPFEVKQSDGTKIKLRLRGDEFMNWHEDTNGYTVVRDAASKDWFYAELDKTASKLVPTSVRVGSGTNTLKMSRHLLPPQKVQNATLRRSQMTGGTVSRASYLKTSGTVTQLVVLVEFSDVKLTKTKAQFEALFNTIGYAADGNAGSVRDFYKEISYGKVDLQSTVVGPITLPNTMAYYGADNYWIDLNVTQLGIDAAAELHKQGFDFSPYDADRDGWLDELDIIHAGHGQEAGADDDCIWSCRWSPEGYFAMYDGVKFGGFHTEPELRNVTSTKITQVGVICHELGHSFGLPDLYDTTYASEGAGNFCLMAAGNWGYYGSNDSGTCPAHMSAWCKKKLGWLTPTEITKSGTYSLARVEDHALAYKMTGSGFGSQEYFLIENRTNTGFDRGAPGSTKGMLIWHVDDSKSSNDDSSHYMVDLEEASTTQHLELSPYSSSSNRGEDSDYFRSTTKTSFTSSTTPNNKSYNGTALSTSISGISAAGSTMSFTASTQDRLPDAPDIWIGTYGTNSANTSYIKVTWDAVSGATSYNIYRSTFTTRPSTPIARNVSSPYQDYKTTSSLVPGVKYYYWVSAQNAAGESYSDRDWGNILVNLSVDKSSANFGASGGQITVSVTANTTWSVATTGSWVSSTTPNGKSGNGTVVLTAAANTATTSRSGTLTLVAGGTSAYPKTLSISLTQAAAESLPEFVIVDHVLVGYNGTGGTVTIPSEVYSIAQGVFKNNENVTKVITTNALEAIDKEAFYGCTSLTQVDFAEGLVSIGERAFGNCTALTELTLPSALENIGNYAFIGCSALKNVTYLCSAAPTVEAAIYRNTPTTLVSHVPAGSTGWNGVEGSTTLPALFPTGGTDGRLILRPGVAPVKPVLTIATRGEDALTDRIVIQWTAVDGETYNIYRATTNTRPTTALATGVSPNYIDLSSSGLEVGVTYYYWVEAVTSVGTTFSESAWGNIAEEPAVPDQPTIVSAEGDTDGISLAWASAFGAETYRVYRSTVSGQIGSALADGLTETTYRDTTCEAGLDYWYTVAAENAYGVSYSGQVSAHRLVEVNVGDLIVLPPEGGTNTFTFTFANGWSMNKSGFFTTATHTLNGQCTVAVSAAANTTGVKRTGTIVLTVGSGTSHPSTTTITVEQDYVKDIPPPESEDGLTLRRFWPDSCEAQAEGQFELASATTQLKFKVTDVDYGNEIDANDCYFTIYDSEDEFWSMFGEGDEVAAGTVKFRLSWYGFFGTRAVKVSVSADNGRNWTDSKTVRIDRSYGDYIWGNGEEAFYDGITSGVTNTALATNGIYTWGNKQVYLYNADDVAVEEGRIATNTLWTAEKLHVLRGDVVVPSGVTLTIANGARVRRFESSAVIHVQQGGAIRLLGTSFEKVYELDAIFDGAVDYYSDASDFVTFDDEMTSTLAGGIYGEYEEYSFRQDYTVGETVGDLPVPDLDVAGCTFGGWTCKDANWNDIEISSEAIAANLITAYGGSDLTLNAYAKWIPAMPTGIYAITSGSEIESSYYGRKVIIRWTKVASQAVTGYTVELFGAGKAPLKTETVDQPSDESVADFVCYDIQSEWGIYGGETVYCRVCATTESGTGTPLEFSFDLPLVLDLNPSEVTVENYGASDSFIVDANVQWTVQSLNTWISVENPGNSSMVDYTVAATDSMAERTGRIQVTGGGVTRTLLITQDGDPDRQRKVTEPEISPMDGTAFTNATCTVTITCSTTGATVYYTTDGSDPSATNGKTYTAEFTISKTTEIRAIAIKSGLEASEIVRSRITKLVPDSEGGTDVPIDVGGGKTISIPRTWLETYYPDLVGKPIANCGSVALSKTGKYDCNGNEMYVWQDYVAGTDPTNKASQFRVKSITVTDGVANIDWEPSNLSGRTYTLKGKAKLTDATWTEISPTQTSGYKFFKVEVDLK